MLGRIYTLVGITALSLTMSCNSSQKEENAQTSDSTTAAANTAKPADSMSVFLADIAAELTPTQHINVADDPVFHQAKRYEGLPLKDVLEKYTKIRSLDPSKTQIVFECEDGYNPSMSLQKVLAKRAFIAVRDSDAPQGQDWINPKKEGREMKIAPFYVVYTDVPAADISYKWPYNLVKISLASASDELAVIFPKDDDTVVKGYELFRVNCLTCHALNKVGGKMGPELNAPMNVTEYWQIEHLKKFVKAPSAYRHDCKMPAQGHLSSKEIDEIVQYLQYIAKHKV
jgi:mono/diheme cytochrome c family protein